MENKWRNKFMTNTEHKTNLLYALHKTYLNKLLAAFRNCICVFYANVDATIVFNGHECEYVCVLNASECWISAPKRIVSFSFQLQVNQTNLKIRYFICVLLHFCILQTAYWCLKPKSLCSSTDNFNSYLPSIVVQFRIKFRWRTRI